MKTAFIIIFAAFFFSFLIPAPAHAQCLGACLQGFTIAPSTVLGDQSDFATAIVTVYVGDPNEVSFSVFLSISGPGSVGVYCGAG